MSALAPHEVAKAFGATLREARTAAGISQEMLAELADCDRTYPSLLERGLRQPTIGKMIEISQALGIDPSALISMTLVRLRGGGT